MKFHSVFIQLAGFLAVVTCSFGQAPAARSLQDPAPGATGADQKLGVVKGKVIAADTGMGLRKAAITLRAIESQPGEQPLTAKTNENGEYQFNEVKQGRYILVASRNGYVRQTYGQKATDLMNPSSGTPLELRSGEVLSQINFRLIRGGVIEGHIVDQDGEPLPRVMIQLSRYRVFQGKRTLMPFGNAQTDDRGQFRLFDISPGSYYLSATYRSFGFPEGGQATYPPTYYPGVLNPHEAAKIPVTAGAEIQGIDMALMETSGHNISGRVVGADGKPAHQVFVTPMKLPFEGSVFMSGGNSTDLQGNFKLTTLVPGRYRLIARATKDGKMQSAGATVDLGNEDVGGVIMVLGDGGEISGKILVDSQQETLDPRRIRISLVPEGEGGISFFGAGGGETKEDFTFRLTNVSEGPVRFRVNLPPGNFYVKSIRMEGREVVDQPIEIKNNERVGGVEVVLSSEGGQVAGVVRKEENGEVVRGATVVLFSTNHDLRSANSRFTKTTQTDQQGSFSLKGVVPGGYVVCALTNHEFGAEGELSYLKEIEKSAKKIELGPSQTQTETLIAIPAPATE